MIRGIFFDLGWTLELPETGDWMLTKCFRKYISEELQATVDPQLWRKALMTASQPLTEHHKITTLAEEADQFTGWYMDLLQTAGLPVTPEIAREIALDRTYEYDKYIVPPEVPVLLRELKAEGYKLGVISDTWPSIVPQLEHAGILQYFDCLTFSYQLGFFKPDPRLFQDALAKMALPAGETVFIDDLVKNLESAEALGIHPVLSRLHGAAPDSRWPHISSPAELPAVLKEMNQ